MTGSISDVRESLNDEVAKLREVLRQAARHTEKIAALDASLVELERRRAQNESIKAKQRLNEPAPKPLPPALPIGDRLVRVRDLKEFTGLGTSSIYKMISEGRFPKPVKLGERAVAWRYSDLIAWLGTLE